jgi:hypothetical protein
LGAQCNRCSGCRRAEGAVGDARSPLRHAPDSALRRWHTPFLNGFSDENNIILKHIVDTE